jgi:hypothetical protein
MSHIVNRDVLVTNTASSPAINSNTIDANTEKEALLGFITSASSQRRSSISFKSLFFALLGCCLALTLLLTKCMPITLEEWQTDESSSISLGLVKNAVAVPSATPSSAAVLEVFQVYQPVLTPSGVTDEATSDSGSENTTIIASSQAASSCQVTLMVHTFAYSYGLPYVGEFPLTRLG